MMKMMNKKDFLNDLYLFYRLFIASNYKDSVPAPHIKKLSRKLMDLRTGNGKHRLAVSMPPRHSKSSMVTLAFPLWLLFQNPNTNILIVTGSPKLSDKFGIQLREYIRNLGPYFNVYLSDVKQASTHLMFCDKNKKLYRGNILLASSGGGITGQDADYLIVDDPYRGNDDEFTPGALQKKIDWANRVVEQRIEPHTKYCILHTRWHDLSDNTPVYTVNKGWTTHGDLEVGDILLGTNNKHTKIIKVHPKTNCNNCLCFSNGDKIICGDEHLWKIHDATDNKTKILTTYNIMQRLSNHTNNGILFTIPLNKSKCIAIIDAYKTTEIYKSNCITVDAHDGIYKVGKHKTPTHNSNDLIGYYRRVDPESYDFIEFPALDDENEPLWKERYSTEELLKKKEVVGERVFQSVYQQKPIDATSDFFNMKHLKFGVPENFNEQSVCRAWDIASSDALSKNDFTAGAKLQRYDDYCIISDLVHGRFGGHTKNIIQETAIKDTPNTHIVIETGVAAAGKLLYDEWRNQLQGFIVEQAKVSGGKSKVDRATPFKNAVEDGKVYIDIKDPVLRQIMIDELSSFPNGENDDITDAISHGYNYLFVNEDVTKKTTAKMGVVFL